MVFFRYKEERPKQRKKKQKQSKTKAKNQAKNQKQKGLFKDEAFSKFRSHKFCKKKKMNAKTEAIQILSKKKAKSIRRKRG